MAIEKDFFRQVMGSFSTGVTVVTTEHDEVLSGLTLNAFSSVSLNPPLVLICVDLSSRTLPLMRASKKFAVNILSEEQEELARYFARPSKAGFKSFSNVEFYEAATGAPVFYDALGFVDAHVVAEYPGGDHAIFLGQVQALGTHGNIVFANDELARKYPLRPSNHDTAKNQKPIAFFEGKYRQLADLSLPPSLVLSSKAE